MKINLEKSYRMKTKLMTIICGIVLSCFLTSFFSLQQANPTLLLTSAKTNKSVNVLGKNTPKKLETVLGAPISIDKEIPDANEEPIFTFTYDGLVIEMQKDMARNVSITSKKWKLNTLTVGMSLEQMAAKFERSEFNYIGYPRFKVKDSKAILYTETDQANKIKKIGITF